MNAVERAQTADQPRISSSSLGQRAGDQLYPSQDLLEYAKFYAREKPEVVAMWCFGIGFILGWKLKPW